MNIGHFKCMRLARRVVLLSAAALWLLIVGVACSSSRVYSEADHTVSFANYKTFALVEGEKDAKGSRLSPIAESNLERAITDEMGKRGYKADEREPDLLVKYNFTVDTRSQTTSRPVYERRPTVGVGGAPFAPRYYVYNRPYVAGHTVRTTKFKEGTLAIDIIDRKENRLVWRGWAEDALKDMGNLSEALPDAAADIFKEFSRTTSR